MKYLYKLLSTMPAMGKRKSPALSFIVGFFSSFWGLGLYFRTTIDVLIAVTFTFLVINLMASDINPWLMNPFADILVSASFTGLYAWLRAIESNRRARTR